MKFYQDNTSRKLNKYEPADGRFALFVSTIKDIGDEVYQVGTGLRVNAQGHYPCFLGDTLDEVLVNNDTGEVTVMTCKKYEVGEDVGTIVFAVPNFSKVNSVKDLL